MIELLVQFPDPLTLSPLLVAIQLSS